MSPNSHSIHLPEFLLKLFLAWLFLSTPLQPRSSQGKYRFSGTQWVLCSLLKTTLLDWGRLSVSPRETEPFSQMQLSTGWGAACHLTGSGDASGSRLHSLNSSAQHQERAQQWATSGSLSWVDSTRRAFRARGSDLPPSLKTDSWVTASCPPLKSSAQVNPVCGDSWDSLICVTWDAWSFLCVVSASPCRNLNCQQVPAEKKKDTK